MYTSIFELFKVGIGPSSSHTIGPMNASNIFVNKLLKTKNQIKSINVVVYGSLALTGKGHGTDLGIVAGLLGIHPENAEYSKIKRDLNKIILRGMIYIPLLDENIKFDYDKNITFNTSNIKSHKYSNALQYEAKYQNGSTIRSLYYSIGGGFILDDNKTVDLDKNILDIYDFESANSLLKYCNKKQISIDTLIMNNEKIVSRLDIEEIKIKIFNIWKVMNKSIYNGMKEAGILYGGLKIRKRAKSQSFRFRGKRIFCFRPVRKATGISYRTDEWLADS